MTAVDLFVYRVGGQHLKRVLDLFQQMALILFDSQNVVALLVTIFSAMARWQPIASMVTTVPLSSSASSSFGIAVISLDFSSTRRWARTRQLVFAQAETICTMAFLSAPFLLGSWAPAASCRRWPPLRPPSVWQST